MYDGLSSYYTLFIRIHRLSCQVCMLFLDDLIILYNAWLLQRGGDLLFRGGAAECWAWRELARDWGKEELQVFFVIKTKMFTSRKFHPKQIWSTTYCQRGGGSSLENTTRPFFSSGLGTTFSCIWNPKKIYIWLFLEMYGPGWNVSTRFINSLNTCIDELVAVCPFLLRVTSS